MRYLLDRTWVILFNVFALIINFINLFASSVIVYEVTNGVQFNWSLFVANRLFWIISALQIAYIIATCSVNYKATSFDDKLQNAIITGEIKLTQQAVKFAKKGDFKAASKSLTMADEFKKRGER